MELIKRIFPNRTVKVVHQTGQVLDENKGLIVTVYRDESGMPTNAEIESGDDIYADIGLTFDGKKLIDYDGVFELPKEVESILFELGFDCSMD